MKITKIGVIGAGIMGSGIAKVCAQAGYEVIIRDIEERFVEKGLQTIRGSLDRMVEKEKLVREEAEAALQYAHQANNLARKIGERSGEAWSLLYMGYALLLVCDF